MFFIIKKTIKMENSKKHYVAKENLANENYHFDKDFDRTGEKMDKRTYVAKEDLKDKSNEIGR